MVNRIKLMTRNGTDFDKWSSVVENMYMVQCIEGAIGGMAALGAARHRGE
jgi:hypothetical protein